MIYAEASHYDGYFFHHIAAWEEMKRLEHRIRMDRRRLR